jgi:hypothetical protein
MQSRLPHFKRAPIVSALQLAERDRHIIRLFHRHRFLRSSQIAALMGGSQQQFVRRLQLLYEQVVIGNSADLAHVLRHPNLHDEQSPSKL